MTDLASAARRTADVVANIGDDQLASPTPCPSYTVGDLLDHVNGLSLAFTDAATKTFPDVSSPPPPGDAAQLRADWRDRIPERLHALAEAWKDPAAFEGMTKAGGIEMPGPIAAIVALDEVIVHGWDLAAATGQDYDADVADIEVCMQTMGPQPDEERPEGPDVAFGRPHDVPEDARPIDRLVALLGRDPSWTPTS